jgi:ABC-type Na+ efflux pump permease subunit
LRIQKAVLIFRKDWLEVRRNWQVMLPIVLIPLMFSVLLPTMIIALPSLSTVPGSSSGDMQTMIDNLPGNVRSEVLGMTDQQVLVYIMSVYFFAPFFLIIPLTTSSVIASDSIAGEKERKTIEALLATPISDAELFLGKILVSFIPTMIVSVLSFVVYSVIVDVASFSLFHGRFLLPNLSWLMLIFGLSPTLALASIGLAVIVSTKVKGFKEAQQINGLLLIPVLALLFGQISGAIIIGPQMILAMTGILVFADVIVFRLGTNRFNREEILSRLG